jgi:hypothetical protein
LEAVVRLKPAQQRDTQRDNSFIFDAPPFLIRIEGRGAHGHRRQALFELEKKKSTAFTMSSPKEKTEVPSFLSISHWVQSTAL